MSYCVAGRVSLLLAVPPGYATSIWPSAGIALAAALIVGPRVWPGIWAGSFAVNIWMSFDSVASGDLNAIAVAAFIACGASIQALWSVWLLERFRAWPTTLESGAAITRLLVVGGPAGCIANATIGVSGLLATGLIAPAEFGFNWLNWWVGDAIGVVVVTPIVLIWSGAMGDFWRQRAVAVSVPLVIALLVVIVSFLIASNREQARIESEFRDSARHLSAAVRTRTEAIIEVLGSLQSYYASSERVDPEAFRVFTQRALRVNPDLLALSWNPYVLHSQRQRYEGPPLNLRFIERDAEGNLVDAAQRGSYVIVQYIEPLSENGHTLGFNVGSDPSRFAAIERARDSAAPAATGRLHLVQSERSEPGLLIFAPVYTPGSPIATLPQRRESILGYVVGVILARPLLEAAIADLRLDYLSISLHDETEHKGGEPLVDWASHNADTMPLLSQQHRLPFAGRRWRLDVSAGAGYIALHRASGLGMVLGIGLLLSGLLGAFNLTLAGNERREAIRAAQDALTGLANRSEFEKRLGNALSACRDFRARHALAYCDLDKFKLVNDTAGHQAGDELLKQVAGLLQAGLRARDTVARLGGDEFGLLLENCPIDNAAKIAQRICRDIRSFQFHWNGEVFHIGVSIGVIELDANAGDIADVTARADVACYTAKDLGRNRVHVDRAGSTLVRRRQSELQRVAELRSTIDKGGLLLYKQPIWALGRLHGAPAAFELLLRLRGPNGEALTPGGAIAAAERYGIMAEVDRWVIRNALRQGSGLCADGQVININLSANSLDDESLADYVHSQLQASGFPPEQVCFEITETAAISNLDAAVRFMQQTKSLDCKFALDDFGAGISSFRYLKSLPVDWLKIDGGLVQDIADDETARAMVASIQQVADAMRIAAVAEWVSDESILAELRGIGVGFAQGFALGRPEPLHEPTHPREAAITP